MKLGISTFRETTPLEKTGQAYNHEEHICQLVKEIELAGQVAFDVYGIGEHYRQDFAVNTKRIKLTSAVSIISSMDSVSSMDHCCLVKGSS